MSVNARYKMNNEITKLINNLKKRWQNIKQSCKGWTVDEFIVEQES